MNTIPHGWTPKCVILAYSRYYSSPHAMYMTYSNGNTTKWEQQLQSLRTALMLAHLLNRTLILPEFSCDGCTSKACSIRSGKCNLMAHLEMAVFNEHFEYREYMFLSHPLVPSSIKTSVSQEISFQSVSDFELNNPLFKDNHHILVVKSLDGYIPFLEKNVDKYFLNHVNNGLKGCDYNQHCTMHP